MVCKVCLAMKIRAEKKPYRSNSLIILNYLSHLRVGGGGSKGFQMLGVPSHKSTEGK